MIKIRLDKVIYLISDAIAEDDLGNQIPDEGKKRKVFAEEIEVGMNEFYNAAVSDMKPEIRFRIHASSYKGESKLEYNKIPYEIIRAPKRGIWINITCEKVIGNGKNKD